MLVDTRSSWLAVCSLAVLSACAPPTVRLRAPERFDSAQVARLGWEDRCGLQKFFDQAPPPNRRVLVRIATAAGSHRSDAPLGEITYEIADPLQKGMLRNLVERLYGPVPVLAAAPSLEVSVDFYTYCGKPRMMLNSDIVIRSGNRAVRLAYHPCLGELLMNGDIYHRRQLLIAGTR